jgi:hypothetical protein
MVFPPEPPSPLVRGWWERHRRPANFALHVLGIPPTIAGVYLIPVWLFGLSGRVFLFALGLFVGGYLVQFLAHAIDGSMPGELTGLRRCWERRRARTRRAVEAEATLETVGTRP